MPDQEWENKMNELRDSQLVTQRLLERLEGTVGQIGEHVQVLTSVVLRHENEIAELRSRRKSDISELRAMLASLITNIDRFIQGWQSNGH
jgi:hypothetical protein